MKTVRVLLMEDNPADIELMMEALKMAELEPVLEVFTDFEQAKMYIEHVSPEAVRHDVILLDLNLPKGNGFELMRMFRSSSRFEKVPVIVVSSSDAARDRTRAEELGVLHYFRKPTDLEEFMRLGKVVLDSLTDKA